MGKSPRVLFLIMTFVLVWTSAFAEDPSEPKNWQFDRAPLYLWAVNMDGEMTVKRLRKSGGKMALMPDNGDYEPLRVSGDMNCEIWGVVTAAIHEL